MLALSEEQLKYVTHFTNGTIDIDGVTYICKAHVSGMEYSEIIAEKVCRILGINCAHYESLVIGNDIYYFSKHLNTIGKFIPGDDLGIRQNTLYDVWAVLEEYFGDASLAMEDLVKIYLFDILFINSDRDNRNFGLVRVGNETRIYAYDNEFIFDDCDKVSLSAKYERHDELRNPHEWNVENYEEHVLKENMLELEYFLSESEDKYSEILENMLNIITPEMFLKIIQEVELEVNDVINNRDVWYNLYRKNYYPIKELLESRKIKRV